RKTAEESRKGNPRYFEAVGGQESAGLIKLRIIEHAYFCRARPRANLCEQLVGPKGIDQGLTAHLELLTAIARADAGGHVHVGPVTPFPSLLAFKLQGLAVPHLSGKFALSRAAAYDGANEYSTRPGELAACRGRGPATTGVYGAGNQSQQATEAGIQVRP